MEEQQRLGFLDNVFSDLPGSNGCFFKPDMIGLLEVRYNLWGRCTCFFKNGNETFFLQDNKGFFKHANEGCFQHRNKDFCKHGNEGAFFHALTSNER